MRHRSTPSEFGSSAFTPSYPGTARQRAGGSQEEASSPTGHPQQSERDVATVCSVSLHSDGRIPSRGTRKKNGKGPPCRRNQGGGRNSPQTYRARETRDLHAGKTQGLPHWRNPGFACSNTTRRPSGENYCLPRGRKAGSHAEGETGDLPRKRKPGPHAERKQASDEPERSAKPHATGNGVKITHPAEKRSFFLIFAP